MLFQKLKLRIPSVMTAQCVLQCERVVNPHPPPCPTPLHGSCSSRNKRQNCVSFCFGGNALIRDSCAVRSSKYFYCIHLFILKTVEVVKKKKKTKKTPNKNPPKACSKQFCRSKCRRKEEADRVLRPQ